MISIRAEYCGNPLCALIKQVKTSLISFKRQFRISRKANIRSLSNLSRRLFVFLKKGEQPQIPPSPQHMVHRRQIRQRRLCMAAPYTKHAVCWNIEIVRRHLTISEHNLSGCLRKIIRNMPMYRRIGLFAVCGIFIRTKVPRIASNGSSASSSISMLNSIILGPTFCELATLRGVHRKH